MIFKMAAGSKKSVFAHRQPMPVQYMESRVIQGREGVFRNKVTLGGFNVENEVIVGIAVQQDSLGASQGCRVLKVGRVAPSDLNSKDIWPDSPEAKVQIPAFCVSSFGDYNGMMATPYADIEFKIKVKEGDNWTTVKEGERENMGYGGMAMRMFLVPGSCEGGFYTIMAVPVTLKKVGSLEGEPASRSYPGIKIARGKFKFASPETEEQKFGLGIQPWFIVSDLLEEAEGGQDLSGVNWLSSMTVKKIVAMTLGSANLPNWHSKSSRWKDTVSKKVYEKVMPPETWPQPRQEYDGDSEVDNVSEDDGESGDKDVGSNR